MSQQDAYNDKVKTLERLCQMVSDIITNVPNLDRKSKMIVRQSAAAFHEIFQRDFPSEDPVFSTHYLRTSLVVFLSSPQDVKFQWYKQQERFSNTLGGFEAVGFSLGLFWLQAANIHEYLDDEYSNELWESIDEMYKDFLKKADDWWRVW